MGIVTHNALPYTDRRVDVHTIKEHFLLLMTAVALIGFRRPQLGLVGRSMGIMTGRTKALFHRLVNLRLGKAVPGVTLKAKGVVHRLENLRIVCRMRVVAGRATAISNRPVHVGGLQHGLTVLVADIAEFAVRQHGMAREIRSVGTVAR